VVPRTAAAITVYQEMKPMAVFTSLSLTSRTTFLNDKVSSFDMLHEFKPVSNTLAQTPLLY